jgi:hypothetical protein
MGAWSQLPKPYSHIFTLQFIGYTYIKSQPGAKFAAKSN